MRTITFLSLFLLAMSALGQTWQNPHVLIHSGQLPSEQEILEVSLKWMGSGIQITEATKRFGYVSRSQPEGRTYFLELWDQQSNILSRHPISLPDKVFGAPLREEHEVSSLHAQDHLRILSEGEDVVNLPFASRAKTVALYDGKKQLLGIRGIQAFKPASPGTFQSLYLGPKRHWRILNPVHITFIGHGFSRTAMDTFHKNVDDYIAALFRYEPFRSRQGHFIFHRVENTKSLKCAHDKVTPRLLVCNAAKVTKAVTNAGAPADQIAVIVNTSTYGGSGGTHAVTYNGVEGAEVFVHEIAHSFGWLRDEYIVANGGQITNQTSFNCYAGTPPAAEWRGVVGASDYFLGCHFADWYRSSATSLMLTIRSPFFNRISVKLLDERIDSVLQKP